MAGRRTAGARTTLVVVVVVVVANDELLLKRRDLRGHGVKGVLNGIGGCVVNVDKVQIGLVGRKERRVLGSVDGDAEQHEMEVGD